MGKQLVCSLILFLIAACLPRIVFSAPSPRSQDDSGTLVVQARTVHVNGCSSEVELFFAMRVMPANTEMCAGTVNDGEIKKIIVLLMREKSAECVVTSVFIGDKPAHADGTYQLHLVPASKIEEMYEYERVPGHDGSILQGRGLAGLEIVTSEGKLFLSYIEAIPSTLNGSSITPVQLFAISQ